MTFEEMSSREGLVEDPVLQAWVDRIGADIARQSHREHLHYRYYILNTNENNAYSLPGGYNLVTIGLLNHVTSDDELAGVLGHEMAHSTDRDFARVLRQQLLFLGLQSALRSKANDTWVLASQFLQVFETARRSRAHEAEADHYGALITFQAAYDPQGIVDFLQTLSSPRQGLDRFTASHPAGSQRVQSMQLRVRELKGAHYDYLMQLGQSLQARHHLRRALAIASLAAEQFPRESAPLLLVGGIQEQRGNAAAARIAFQRALARNPECAEAATALDGLTTSEPVVGPPVSLPEDLQAQVNGIVGDLRRDEAALHEAEQALRKSLTKFDSDRQIAEALQVAQMFSPELDDVAYMSTLARAYRVLARAQREAHRQAEVLARGASVRLGWERVASELTGDKVSGPAAEKDREVQVAELQQQAQIFLQDARPAVRATTTQVRLAGDNCAQLTTATRMLSAAFLALVGSGPHQPLGRINYTRFLLFQGDILAAEGRIKKSEQISDRAMRVIFDEHLQVTQAAIATLHATAPEALRQLDVVLLAQRLQVQPAALAAQNAPLGEAAMCLLDGTVSAKGLAAMQVKDCLLRIAYLDMAAEREPGSGTGPDPATRHFAAATAPPATRTAEISR